MPQTLYFLAMPLTDAEGNPEPNAVWWSEQKTECPRQKAGSILWYAFRDPAAFAAGLQNCGQHAVQVDAATFTATAASPPQGVTQAENYFRLSAGLSQAIKDTPALDATGKPLLDANNQPVMQSFFAWASVVSVTVPDGT